MYFCIPENYIYSDIDSFTNFIGHENRRILTQIAGIDENINNLVVVRHNIYNYDKLDDQLKSEVDMFTCKR